MLAFILLPVITVNVITLSIGAFMCSEGKRRRTPSQLAAGSRNAARSGNYLLSGMTPGILLMSQNNLLFGCSRAVIPFLVASSRLPPCMRHALINIWPP